jgi:hypothetical protein
MVYMATGRLLRSGDKAFQIANDVLPSKDLYASDRLHADARIIQYAERASDNA